MLVRRVNEENTTIRESKITAKEISGISPPAGIVLPDMVEFLKLNKDELESIQMCAKL